MGLDLDLRKTISACIFRGDDGGDDDGMRYLNKEYLTFSVL